MTIKDINTEDNMFSTTYIPTMTITLAATLRGLVAFDVGGGT